MSWLTEFPGPDPAMNEVVATIGALLVGRTTFGGDDPHRGTEKAGEPVGGGWRGPQFARRPLEHRDVHDPPLPRPPVRRRSGRSAPPETVVSRWSVRVLRQGFAKIAAADVASRHALHRV